LLSGDIKA